MKNLINDISENHTKNVVICCQETWKYNLPNNFKKQFCNKYHFIHQSAMDAGTAQRRGRPFGGVCFIISKAVAFKVIYSNARCISIVLSDYNILLNNVYLPFNDSRKSSEQNLENMLEALGHLDAAHNLSTETIDNITLGDFNVSPNDTTQRACLITQWLRDHSYENIDLNYLPPNEYSHKSGRLIDRFVSTTHIGNDVENVKILKEHLSSDHFPIVASIRANISQTVAHKKNPYINWNKASKKSIESYSRLCNKKCKVSLEKYNNGEINGVELYGDLINNLEVSAQTCLPKTDPNKTPRRHNIPMWRERMSSFKHEVDYWLQLQFLHGGPNNCGEFIQRQVRLSKSRYRRQFRILRREIEINVAESTTLQNCFKRLTSHPKSAQPAKIDGHSIAEQPAMWHKHLREVYKAEDTPYNGNLLQHVNSLINIDVINSFEKFNINDINSAIFEINTNKSFTRHHHWKFLLHNHHYAKQCLNKIFNFWVDNILQSNNYLNWDLFLTNVSFIPKRDKKDMSLKGSWRPISIGSSENWILEKILVKRVYPYLKTSDFQFGYKPKHGTTHAIEIIRIIERHHDSHICLLDASSAFDSLSWRRIYDQFLKRNVPLCLIKVLMMQLFSTKISVCKTSIFYPRAGVKQGGVLSGIIFASCYDDLVDMLKSVGAGVLLNAINNTFKLIFVLIYADDIVLIVSSPNGLKELIKKTFIFAQLYCDLAFNPTKSWILRLGPGRKPPVSVCGIPTTDCKKYIGVEIGPGADPVKKAATKLYTNANVLLRQNRELKKCSVAIKNVCIYLLLR